MWTRVIAFAALLVYGGTEVDHAGNGEKEYCECVPYYLCPNGSDEGMNTKESPRKCENLFDVCCESSITEAPNTPAPTLTTHKAGCGHRNPDGVGFRITGKVDNQAQFGEFPWMVAVMRVEMVDPPEGEEVSTQARTVYQCGGSLIHPKAVLTGAHCVAGREKDEVKIRAGEWDTKTKNEIFGFQDRDVERIVVHENFNGGNLFNDVAILFLSEPVEQTENIGFACVPKQGYVTPPGTRCFATGWGKDVSGSESGNSGILKKIDLPVIANPQCQAALRDTILGRHFKLNQSFMCAGGEQGKDTCKGDGGSPLVCPLPDHPDIYIQSGIVAWGIGCGENQVPGVYANVALFRNWIDGQMQEAQLDPSSYSY